MFNLLVKSIAYNLTMKIIVFVLLTFFSVSQCNECVDTNSAAVCAAYSNQGWCVQANIMSVCYKTCNPVSCDDTPCTGMPTIASNGGNDPSGTTHQAGVTVTYACDINYILDGAEFNTCQVDGSWAVDTAPTCIQECPDPISDPSLSITPDGPYKVGDTITYECVDQSAEEIGDKVSTCMTNGSPYWNLTVLPACNTSNACGPPPMIVSDGINPENRDYATGSNVTYQCNPRRVLGGSMTNLCTNNVWCNPAPVCYQDCVDHQDCTDNVDFRYCTNPSYTYTSMEFCLKSCNLCGTCDEAPEHPSVTSAPAGPFEQGSNVDYTCAEGKLSGQSSNICVGQNEWSNESPTCLCSFIFS